MLLDILPPDYTAAAIQPRPPSYTDQSPPRYSYAPPPYSDIHLYPGSNDLDRVSCDQRNGQSRATAIIIISNPEVNSDTTTTNIAYTGSFPTYQEYINSPVFRPETSLTGSGQNNTTSNRLENGIGLTVLAVVGFLCCPVTGCFALYFVYRKHKARARARNDVASEVKEKEEERRARLCIFVSCAVFIISSIVIAMIFVSFSLFFFLIVLPFILFFLALCIF